MRVSSIASGLLAAVVSSGALLAAYDDPTILTIQDASGVAVQQYPLDRLRRDFQNVEIETRTPWTTQSEATRYRGPRIVDVLSKYSLDAGQSVQFIAYDNFVSEILIDEIRDYEPIFAIDRACRQHDHESGRCTAGQTFTPLVPEEQGPIFLIWPLDRLPAAYVPARNSIWVWFVVAVRPVQ